MGGMFTIPKWVVYRCFTHMNDIMISTTPSGCTQRLRNMDAPRPSKTHTPHHSMWGKSMNKFTRFSARWHLAKISQLKMVNNLWEMILNLLWEMIHFFFSRVLWESRSEKSAMILTLSGIPSHPDFWGRWLALCRTHTTEAVKKEPLDWSGLPIRIGKQSEYSTHMSNSYILIYKYV